MIHPEDRDHRLNELADAVCRGDVTPSEMAELDALLVSDSAARSEYLELCRLHAELGFLTKSSRSAQATLEAVDAMIEAEIRRQEQGTAAELAKANADAELARKESACGSPSGQRQEAGRDSLPGECGPDSEEHPAIRSGPVASSDAPALRSRTLMQRASRRPVRPALAVAALAMISVLTWMGVTSVKNRLAESGSEKRKDEQREPVKEPTFVALLNQRRNAVWLDDTRPSMGDPRLEVGRRLSLVSGFIEVKYYTGAIVVIEGPAEFTIGGQESGVSSRGRKPMVGDKEANSGYLKHGSLVARCEGEDAKHFTIHTPAASVEDLGTEFGVSVDAAGLHQVEVVDGKIKVRRLIDGTVVTLVAGEGIRLARNDASMVVHKLDDPRGYVVRGVLGRRYLGKSRLDLQDAVSVSLHGTRTDPKTSVGRTKWSDATRFLIRERKMGRTGSEKEQVSESLRTRLFLKFDVSKLSGKVDYASLQMKVASHLPNAPESVIKIARVASAWDTTSGDNFPVFKQPFEDITPTQIDDDATIGSPLTVDLTQLVQQWIDGTHPNHGLVVFVARKDIIGQSYAAGRTGTPPQLSVMIAEEGVAQPSEEIEETTVSP